MLLRVEAPHFVASVVLENGFVFEAAPIVRYMRGWNQTKVLNYCRIKGWKVS